jgi:hypothetical protein
MAFIEKPLMAFIEKPLMAFIENAANGFIKPLMASKAPQRAQLNSKYLRRIHSHGLPKRGHSES